MSDLLLTFDPGTAADRQMGAQMASVLMLHYPGHKWTVVVESANGVGYVQNSLLQSNEAWLVKLGDLKNWSDVKKAMVLAGGEILERFGVRRGRADIGELRHLERNSWKH